MSFIVLPPIGTLTLSVNNFLTLHPALINEAVGHGLAHVLYSHLRRSSRSRGISRRKARKLTNAKRRWFVDNIIMHHKRLHDRNREMAIKNARLRALERRKELEKKMPTSLALSHTSLRKKIDLLEKGAQMRQRYEIRKIRAQSRWASVMQVQRNDKIKVKLDNSKEDDFS